MSEEDRSVKPRQGEEKEADRKQVPPREVDSKLLRKVKFSEKARSTKIINRKIK
jgi:hypothetical protein